MNRLYGFTCSNTSCFFKKKLNSILVVANFNALHLSGIVALLFQIRKITLYCSSLYVDTNAHSQSAGASCLYIYMKGGAGVSVASIPWQLGPGSDERNRWCTVQNMERHRACMQDGFM